MPLFGDFIDQLVDRLHNWVERIFIARQQHPGRERACTFAIEMVEYQVGQLMRRDHPAAHLHDSFGNFAADIVAHISS